MTELTRAQLIALINTVIVANNVGEITGPVLNSVLVDIADSVGTLLDPNTTWSAEEMTIGGLLQFGSTTGISGTATLGTLPVTNTLLLTASDLVPFNVALSFTTSAAVLAYFGAGDPTTLAAQYFADGSPSTLIIIRYPQYGGNARLYGAPLSLTLTQLQAINGTLSVTADGQVFSASINLSAVTSFANAATALEFKGFDSPRDCLINVCTIFNCSSLSVVGRPGRVSSVNPSIPCCLNWVTQYATARGESP